MWKVSRLLFPPGSGLECDLDRDHPDIIGERDEIRRLLTNLLFNAAAAIGEEEGTISVRTQIADGPPWVLEPEERFEFPEGEYVWLQVSDTGEGLDEAARAGMFEPFAGFTGQNLGLATALRIVDRHHGVLSLSSKPGLGTTCHVFLPILPHADPADNTAARQLFLTARRLASASGNEAYIFSLLHPSFPLAHRLTGLLSALFCRLSGLLSVLVLSFASV